MKAEEGTRNEIAIRSRKMENAFMWTVTSSSKRKTLKLCSE